MFLLIIGFAVGVFVGYKFPQQVDQAVQSSKSLFNVWEKRRVYLQNADDAVANFSDFVEHMHPPDGNDCFDFVVIHQGIIDEVKKTLTLDKFNAAWTKLKKRTRWLVIDTGRGLPEQARLESHRWVEYSNVAECVARYAGDKFRFAQLLSAL